jgi:hypothetical protein
MSVLEANPIVFPFAEIMNAVVSIGRDVSERLVVYRWRPHTPQLENGGGALYHMLGDTPHTPADIYHDQDDLLINARIGIRHSDVDDEMKVLELFTSAYVNKMDPQLKRIRPLGVPAVKKAWRPTMRMLEDEFNGVPVLAVEFPLTFTIHREILANT